MSRPPVKLRPTDEQAQILDAALAGESLRVSARAGTGKSSTLRLLAEALPGRRILLLTFNKANAEEAKASFPGHARCMTGHGLAFGQLRRSNAGAVFASRLTQQPWNLGKEVNTRLGTALDKPLGYGRRRATLVATMDTLSRFCQSADPAISAAHVPAEHGALLTGPERQQFHADVARLARQVWAMQVDLDDTLPITHDTYLKYWQLTRPHIDADLILFDEAQDANPVMLDLVLQQRHAQTVFCGDSHQAIYAWRGAVDAMRQAPGRELPLTQSWRFGQSIADEANRILALSGEEHLLRGAPNRVSQIHDTRLPRVDAVLSRSNLGLIGEAERLTRAGQRFHVIGGVASLTRELRAGFEFSQGQNARNDTFAPFLDWDEVRMVADTSQGGSLSVLVKLVDRYGEKVPALCAAIERSHVELGAADCVLSTAHKSKGLEFNAVRLSEDFQPFASQEGKDKEIAFNTEEANLAYVSLTRAHQDLDLSQYRKTLEESIELATQSAAPMPSRLRVG